MKFKTPLIYSDRKTKANYIYDKYSTILEGKILDVGADAMFLKSKFQKDNQKYLGMGYGEGIDLEYNLEILPYPFKDREFDTVLCFDVLEHLENIHEAFRELCRISNKYIIISLPNPWSDFFTILLRGDYSEVESMKFYGLPVKRPIDRHRWFFSESDAKKFISENAKINGWEVVQMDAPGDQKKFGGRGLRGLLIRALFKLIFRRDIDKIGLHHSTSWFVLRKIP